LRIIDWILCQGRVQHKNFFLFHVWRGGLQVKLQSLK
jgi:hypothetical protein